MVEAQLSVCLGHYTNSCPQDGMELREGPLGGESRLTRHYLHLMDLRPQDAGTYTCAAANPLGAAAANWTLRVIGEERENSSCRNAEVIGLWCT